MGAGIIGLTSAIELLQSGFINVTVLGDTPLGHYSTASGVATAIWHVYLVDPTDLNVLRWATTTLDRLLAIADRDAAAGVYTVRGVELFRTTPPHEPSWAHIPPHFEILSATRLEQYGEIRWGYEIEAPLGEMEHYIPWLAGQVRSLGGRISCQPDNRIDKLDQLAQAYDAIVNCTGLDSRRLVPDASVRPVRGQYLVLRRPAFDPGLYIGDDENPSGMAYMIPRRGDICIGGTEEIGEESTEFVADAQEMIERVAETSPWLRSFGPSDVLRRVVGLRPFREKGVALSSSRLEDGRLLIHNYGHGGSGFSLAWGCAQDVAQIMAREL